MTKFVKGTNPQQKSNKAQQLPKIHQTIVFAIAIGVLSFVHVDRAFAQNQEQFSLSLNVGRTIGLTSYRNDITYVENSPTIDPDPAAMGKPLYQPYLGDEGYDWGNLLGLQINFGKVSVEFQGQWFSRNSITLHHKGTQTLPRRRLRSDNSIDDQGTTYTEMTTSREERTTTRGRGDLLVASIMGGWRLSQAYKRFSLFVPMGGGLVITHIDEPNHPYVLGAQLYLGAGSSFALSKNFSVSGIWRIFAMGTFEYDRVDDASRHAQVTGNGTLDAFFSSMIHTGLQANITYIVR